MPERLNVSYHSIGLMVGLAEGASLFATSVVGQALYQRFWLAQADASGAASGVGLIAALIYVSFARFAELYGLPAFLNPKRHFGEILAVWASSLLVLTAVLFLLKVDAGVTRGALLGFSGLGLPLVLTTRFSAAGLIKSTIERGAIAGRPVITIGDPDELALLNAATLLNDFGLKEVGRVTIAPLENDGDLSEARNAAIEEAINLARQWKAEEFVIALGWDQRRLLAAINHALSNSPLPVRLLPDQTVRAILGRQGTAVVGPMLTVELQRAPMTFGECLAKRFVDLSFTSFALLAFMPVLILTALAIKLDSPGPVIFRQRRNGFDQNQFVIYKFRTMRVLEDGEKITQAQRDDPRLTRVGGFLRRTSIDELPQLFNVLMGTMSLVGPRPHALAHDGQYRSLIETYCFRHHVKPGITGWAQVNRARGETARLEQMQQRVEFDVWYINNWSLVLDLRILFRTCHEVLKHEAY